MKLFEFLMIFWVVELSFCQKSNFTTWTCNFKQVGFGLTTALKLTNPMGFTCDLTSNNMYPKDVLDIEGDHKNGQTDDDVKCLLISSNLRTFSSIFCDNFKNIEVLWMREKEIVSIDQDSLKDCGKLSMIVLKHNRLNELPQNLLSGMINLTHFIVTDNNLTSLPENFFMSQNQLKELDLSGNGFNFLPSKIFHPLVNLQNLELKSNKLQTLNPQWFVNLESLKILCLQGNKISDLPVNVFGPLKNLKDLRLAENRLAAIHSDSFGSNLKLTTIYLQDNKITALDERLIDLSAVIRLNMTNNLCCNEYFETRKKIEIKEKLRKCFENYQPRHIAQAETTLASQIDFNICGKAAKLATSLVFGGTQVSRAEFPWIAALNKIDGDFFCGGTLVTNQKVVTAAHCIHDKYVTDPTLAREVKVLLGVHNLDVISELGREEFTVQSIHIHPDWDTLTQNYDADVAVLVLDQMVTFGEFIRPICLFNPASNIVSINHGTVIGFGKSEDKFKLHENIPKKLEIPIHSNSHCFIKDSIFRTISTARTFCGGSGNGTGVCKGDSGSGLYVLYEGFYYFRGIVSASFINATYGCDVDSYAIYTNMIKFGDWVNGI